MDFRDKAVAELKLFWGIDFPSDYQVAMYMLYGEVVYVHD